MRITLLNDMSSERLLWASCKNSVPVRSSSWSLRFMNITMSLSSACTARTPPAAASRSIMAQMYPNSIICFGRVVVVLVVQTLTVVNPPRTKSSIWSMTERGNATCSLRCGALGAHAHQNAVEAIVGVTVSFEYGILPFDGLGQV